MIKTFHNGINGKQKLFNSLDTPVAFRAGRFFSSFRHSFLQVRKGNAGKFPSPIQVQSLVDRNFKPNLKDTPL